MKTRDSTLKTRGFTLIELMVALTGGLFFTIFVFMMTRDVSRFFQGQTRISETTLATVNGFERLRSDISRAGFLASPNISKDINRCPRPNAGAAVEPALSGWSTFPGLQQMALARILVGGTLAMHPANATLVNTGLENTGAGLAPDRIILWGNYTTSEQFPTLTIDADNGIVNLDLTSVALARVGITLADATADGLILDRIFPPGRIVRLTDEVQREQYGIVASTAISATAATITLEASPSLLTISDDKRCGIRGVGGLGAINPVDIIRYQLDTPPAIAHITDGTAPAYENTRLDLVRQVLSPMTDPTSTDATDSTLGESTELIAEYGVDLKFGLTVMNNVLTGSLTYLPEDSAQIVDYAGHPWDEAETNGPHLIRGIHARLMVRNRLADRIADTDSGTILRAYVAPNEFARTRTLQSHIATHNTQNSLWN